MQVFDVSHILEDLFSHKYYNFTNGYQVERCPSIYIDGVILSPADLFPCERPGPFDLTQCIQSRSTLLSF